MMNSDCDQETRNVLSQQPAQCLLIDLGKPFSTANLDIIAECLHHVLPIISILPGPARVPLLGIFVANNMNGLTEEVLFMSTNPFLQKQQNFKLYKLLIAVQKKVKVV